MAEKILIELNFDTKNQTLEAAKFTKAIATLNAENKKLDKTTSEGALAFQRNTEQLKNNKAGLNANNKEITSLTNANKANAGSNDLMKAQLSILTAEYNKLSKEERKNTEAGKQKKQQISQLTDELKDNEEAVGNNRRSVGDYGKALEGTPFGSFIGGIKAIGVAIMANPLAAILGAVVGALALLKSAFTSSEEGQNKYAKAVAVLGSLLDNFTDVLANIAEALVGAFENPQKALKDFATLIKNNIINRFTGLLELVPQLGKAVSQLFKGDFSGAAETAANAAAKVALGVEDIVGKTKEASKVLSEFAKEVKKDGEGAAAVADKRAKADIIERNLLVERARLETRIADLRLKAKQEDTVSAAERRKALIEARDLEDGLLVKEQEVLQLRFDAQKQENTFARSNKENKEKEAQAEALLFKNRTARANAERTIQRELNTVNAQVRTLEKAVLKEQEKEAKIKMDLAVEIANEELKSIISSNQSKLDANQFLNDELVAQEKTRLQLITDANLEFEETRLVNGQINQKEYNAAIAAIVAEGELLKDDLLLAKKEADDEQRIVDIDNQREINILNGESDHETLVKDLERARLAELKEAEKSGADTKLINEKYDDIASKNNQDLANQKVAMAGETFGILAKIAGEESKAGKAFAISQALINTYLGITAGVKLGYPAAIPAVLAASATGFAAVSNITSTPTPKAAKGGIFGGNLHSSGGTKGYFDDGTQIEVEKDELFMVLNRNSTDMINRMSNLNELGGGIAFGGNQTHMADGGIGIGSISNTVDSQSGSNDIILEAIQSMPAPVVIVQDVNEAQGTIVNVENRATI